MHRVRCPPISWGGTKIGVPPQPSEIWGGTTFCPPKVLDYGGALTSKISAPPSGSGWGGTTFDDYLALNSLRNGRFEAENGATVWRAYGATAPSLLASKSLVLTCSIFPRRVPPHPFSHQRFADFQPEVVLPHRWGGTAPPRVQIMGGQLPPPASEIWGGNK